MEIKTNYPLQSLNTFNIKVDGKYFTEVASSEQIMEARAFAAEKGVPTLVLGGGSNLLFTQNYPGLIMRIITQGVSIVDETADFAFVKAGAGENWDHFVAFCVGMGLGGVENLSLIPGCVGASPVQNIGAYGVEMKDHFESLEYFDFERGKVQVFGKEDCKFDYRYSIFKGELKGKGVVLSVTFRLDKKPILKTGYGTIRNELKAMGAKELSIQDVRAAVIRIRESKLPDPEVIGNAGSFFKNPTVPGEIHELLAREHPGLVSFPQDKNKFKLAAGWLIDQCGWKGFRMGDAGVHKDQALVLVNHGEASGEQLFKLSEEIRSSVMNTFHVELEREVNVL